MEEAERTTCSATNTYMDHWVNQLVWYSNDNTSCYCVKTDIPQLNSNPWNHSNDNAVMEKQNTLQQVTGHMTRCIYSALKS